MSRALPLVIPLLAALAVVSTSVERADACSCVQPVLKDQLANSGAVILGTAGERVDSEAGNMAAHASYTFAVERAFKGEAAETFTVRTSGNSAMCGASFVAGKRYVVFASAREQEGGDPVFWTGLCSGNMLATPDLIERIETELGITEDPDPPVQTPPDNPPPPSTPPPAANKGNPACGGCQSSGSQGLASALLILGLVLAAGRGRRRREP